MVSEKLVKTGASLFRRVWTEPTIRHGIEKARKLEKAGGGAILNILGEHHKSVESVKEDVQKYMGLATAINHEGVKARISIKPSQFGFDLTTDEFGQSVGRDVILRRTHERMWSVVNHATLQGIEVEMDMEHSGTHDFTFETYREFCKKLKASGRVECLGLQSRQITIGALEMCKSWPIWIKQLMAE
jgi:TusA-related sulfurtransferase